MGLSGNIDGAEVVFHLYYVRKLHESGLFTTSVGWLRVTHRTVDSTPARGASSIGVLGPPVFTLTRFG